MEFAKLIDFGQIPYKISTERPLYISNNGTEVRHILITQPQQIMVSPQSFTLQPSSSVQVVVYCLPDRLGASYETLCLQVNQSDEEYINVKWDCIESSIALSGQLDGFVPTLIQYQALARTNISNKGEFPVKFSLHSGPASSEPFLSDVFSILPLSGEIYPYSSITLVAKFIPYLATTYRTFAYLYADAQAYRIPIELCGVGISPDVQLDCDVLDFQYLTIGQFSTCQLSILNASDIQVGFRLIEKETPFYLNVSAKQGILPAGQRFDLTIEIMPLRLCDIDEILLFEVLNTTVLLPCQVLAQVVPPAVSVTVDMDDPDSTLSQLCFGVVPFGFGSRREIHLFNHSGAFYKYVVRVEPAVTTDAKLLSCGDFNVSPHVVEIEPGTSAPIYITLLPRYCRGAYDGFVLRVFSDKIAGLALVEIPISAQVSSARFVLEPAVFEIPRAFVGFKHEFDVTIKNASNVVGRWLFPIQDNFDACVVGCSAQGGVLAANSAQKLTISVVPRGPGNLVIPVNFLTDDRQEMQCMVYYQARGPEMQISADSLNFPQTQVLASCIKHLIIENAGLSDSLIHISASKPGSYFTVDVEHQKFKLLAGEKADVPVTLYANVQGNHRDTLIVIQELLNQACDVSDDVAKSITSTRKVALAGSTRGTSLFSPTIDFSKPVDCGVYFLSEPMRTEIIIENRGPEAYNLTWYAGKTARFYFENSKLSLQPGESGVFVLTCVSEQVGTIKEQWVLKTSIPGKSTDTAFVATFECKFIENVVKIMSGMYQVKELNFVYKEFPVFGDAELFLGDDYANQQQYLLATDEEATVYRYAMIKERLTFNNQSQLPCQAQVAVHQPFFVSLNDYETDGAQYQVFKLQPGQNDVEFFVQVDQDYCVGERISANVDSMMLVRLQPDEQPAYRPPLIKIPLHLYCHFPLVSFRTCSEKDVLRSQEDYQQLFSSLQESDAIDFGSLVPGTTVKRLILVKNIGLYPVQMSWSLQDVDESLYTFDITPASIYGDSGLNCGEIGVFEIVFYCKSTSKDGIKIGDCVAVCSVFGGGRFSYQLRAEASNLAIDIYPSNINFGDISYVSEQTGIFTIYNISQVRSSVELVVPMECMPFIRRINDIVVERTTKPVFDFELPGNGKLEVKILCIPRVPGFFNLPLTIKAGHLEEVLFPITGQSYIENVQLYSEDKALIQAQNIFPWHSEFQLPPYSAFVQAAYSYIREFPLKYQLHSTLLKCVNDEGGLACYGKMIAPAPLTEPVDSSSQQVVTELILTNIENFTYYLGEASRIYSRYVRSRQGVNMYFLNDNAIASLKVAKEIPKFPLLFNLVCNMPPTQRGAMCEYTVRLQNMSTNPLVFSIERKYLVAYGINVLPEKLPRILHGESLVLTIYFTPSAECALGYLYFLVPLFFRSSAIGFITCSCNISMPALRPMNLMYLAQNFIELPISMKDQQTHVLNFGMCYYGHSARFYLKICNPSYLNAPYTCHVNGGVGRQYLVGSKEKVGVSENFSYKLDNCFELSQSYGYVAANYDGTVSVTFHPIDWYKLEDTRYGSLFTGELKFSVRQGAEYTGTKLIIKLFGVGYHPQLKISTKTLAIDPVFPREISYKYASVWIENTSDYDFEIYIKQLDVLHCVEQAIMSVATETLDEQGRRAKDRVTPYLANFPRAGEQMGYEILDALANSELSSLATYLVDKYADFIALQSSFRQANANVKSSALTAQEYDQEVHNHNDNTRTSSVASIIYSAYKENAARMLEFNESIDYNDFSYKLTELEETQLKYGKSAPTVFDKKSYRIADNDCTYSNLPFLAYIVHGPPLSGKTEMCLKLCTKISSSDGAQAFVVSLKDIMSESEVFAKFQLLEQQQAAVSKGKKDQQQTVDFRRKAEYLDELAYEYLAKINERVGYYNCLIIGMIFDGIESKFTDGVESTLQVILRILAKYRKETLYASQILTSRLSVNMVILDQDPAITRKKKMQQIADLYSKMLAEGKELEVYELKEQLIHAKQMYDSYNELFQAANCEILRYSSDLVPNNYNAVVNVSDDLGAAHYSFLEQRQHLNDAVAQAKGFVLYLHKELIDKDAILDEMSAEYQQIERYIEATYTELAYKKSNKQLAYKLQDLTVYKEKLAQSLPPHPVSGIPVGNMFTFKYIYQDSLTLSEQLAFTEPLDRMLAALKKYSQALQNSIRAAYIVQRNQRLGLVEILLNCSVAYTKEQLLQSIYNPSSLLRKILDGTEAPETLLNLIYEDSRMAAASDIFYVIPVDYELIRQSDEATERIAYLQEEVNLNPQYLKQLNKYYYMDYASKKQQLQQYYDMYKALFTGKDCRQEIGFARWIIPKNSKQKLVFRFYSNVVKRGDIYLDLQCRNHELCIPLKFQCLCDWPHIISDISLIMPKPSKTRGYKADGNVFNFGNLRAKVPVPELFTREPVQGDGITNEMDYDALSKLITTSATHFINYHYFTLRLVNDSAFTGNVVIFTKSMLGEQQTPEDYLAKLQEPVYEDTKKAKPELRGQKDKAKSQDDQRVFLISQSRLQLSPEQQKYILISAFPIDERDYEETIFVGVEHNPTVLSFGVRCHGANIAYEFVIPECQEELLPCYQLSDKINALCLALTPQADPKLKAKPAAKEKGARAIDKQFLESLVMIPRASLRYQNTVEIPFKNTSLLPICVEFIPYPKDVLPAFTKDFAIQNFTYADEPQMKRTKRDPYLPDEHCLSFDSLIVKNTKFILKPTEYAVMKFLYKTEKVEQTVILAKLLVTYYSPFETSAECGLVRFKEAFKYYSQPILDKNVVVLGEGHQTNMVVAVTKIEAGDNNIIKNMPKFSVDEPITNMGFGICKALNHFRAEITIINRGKYDVYFRATVNKALERQFNFVYTEQPYQQKKGQPQAYQEIFSKAVSQVIKAATEADDSKTKGKYPENVVVLTVNFFAEATTELSDSPALSLVFLDKITQIPLAKQIVTASAKIKYAELQINPDRIMLFGDLSNGKIVTKNITLENTGHFPTQIVVETLSQVLKRKMILGCCSLFDENYAQLQSSLKIEVQKVSEFGVVDGGAKALSFDDTSKTPRGTKAQKPAKDAKVQQQALHVGPFTIYPWCFILRPEQKQIVQVTYTAKQTISAKEYLVIDWSNKLASQASNLLITEQNLVPIQETLIKDFTASPEVSKIYNYYPYVLQEIQNLTIYKYALAGNSYIPGIDGDVYQLFEEYQIQNYPPPDPASVNDGVYSLLANQLCLGNCYLGHTRRERIKFFNPFSVECNFVFLIAPFEQNIDEAVKEQLGDSIQSIQTYIDDATHAGGKAKKPAAPAKPAKIDNQTMQNDNTAWSLDMKSARIMPKYAVYVTVEYKPTMQAVSKAKFVAVSIDNHLRAKELATPDPKGDNYRKMLADLQLEMADSDRKNSLIWVDLLGVGVLPELLVSPHFVDLGRILISYASARAEKISVRNSGRVSASFSVSVRSESNTVQDCFELLGDVDSRLFSGIREIRASESMEFEVRPCFSKLLYLPVGTKQVKAAILVYIMTTEDSYETITIPISFSVLTDDVCCLLECPPAAGRVRFYHDVLQLLFYVPTVPTIRYIMHALFERISESTVHKNARNAYIYVYNSLSETISSEVNVFLADQITGCQGDSISVQLVNQSTVSYAFDAEQQILQQLGIYMTPRCGHLLAGQTVHLSLVMLQPQIQENTDARYKKATTGQGRQVLFGNPLLLRLVPIAFRNPRQATPWTSESEFQEPQHDYLANQQLKDQMQYEWDDLYALVAKKAKLTAQQYARLTYLSKLFSDAGGAVNQRYLACLTNSTFLQLNLFGCVAYAQYKYYSKMDDGAFVQIAVQTFEKYNYLVVNFDKIAILYEAEALLFVLNDGIVAPQLEFTNNETEEDSPFKIYHSRDIMPRPDLFAQVVKELIPQITDVKENYQILYQHGVSSKATDKNFLYQFVYLYSNPQNSPYTEYIRIFFEPQLPGSFCSIYQDYRCFEQLYLQAYANLPICHIKCAPTAYLYCERPASFLTPYTFANLMAKNLSTVKVVEIPGIGVNQRSATSIELLNTISETYEVVLQRLPESNQKISTLSTAYTLASGERISIKFEYHPDRASLKCLAEEAFYILKIAKFNIYVPLLVVGRPSEPDISLSNVKLMFGIIPFGQQRYQELDICNNEDQPYNYAIRYPKCDSNQFEAKIIPQQGIIAAHSKTTLIVQCRPTREASVSKIVLVDVARKSMPLQFNIKYECVKVRHILELLPENEQIGVPAVIQNVMDVDFGTVFLADYKTRRLKLTNTGAAALAFYPKFELIRTISTARRDYIELKQCLSNLRVDVDSAQYQGAFYILEVGSSAYISVVFAPYAELTVGKDFGLFLSIAIDTIGTQRLRLFAKAVKPLLKASGSSIDYGTVLADLVYEKCKCESLSFRNHDVQPLTLEFVSDSSDFYILTPPEQKPLLQGQTRRIEVRFQPIFSQKFRGNLVVTVNGIYKLQYPLVGEAVENRIEISAREIRLGGILTSSPPVIKRISLFNRSAAYITAEIRPHPEADVPEGLFLSIQQADAAGEIVSKALDYLNGWEIRSNKKAYLNKLQKCTFIAPQGSAEILVFYKPYARQAQFTVPIDVIIENCKTIEKICVISGAAIGTSARLLTNSVELPPCLQNSFVYNEFVIENTGDVAIDYSIPIPPKTIIKRQLLEMFSSKIITLSPAYGSIPPGETRPVMVRFAPPAGYPVGRYALSNIPVEYAFYGATETIGMLSIAATCEGKDKFYQSSEVDVNFICPSREQHVVAQRIENATDRVFEVQTVLQGEGMAHYQVPDRLIIQPGGTEFNVVFKPLKQGSHEARLIIPGSEGGASVFKLHGQSEAPNIDGYITNVAVYQPAEKSEKPKSSRGKKVPEQQSQQLSAPVCSNIIAVPEIRAYLPQRVVIPLHNWEKLMQRFVVTEEFVGEARCYILHPDFVDLPPQGTERAVEVQFIAFLQDTEYNGFLIFTNEQTKEFMKYQFKLFAGAPAPALVFSIQSTCRDEFIKKVYIPNPLQRSAFYTLQLAFSSKNDAISVVPASLKISARQIAIPIQVRYGPRVPSHSEETEIEIAVTADQSVALCPMRLSVHGTANAPRPSSVMRITADYGKTAEFSLALQAKPGTYYAALTGITDVYEAFDILDRRQIQKGGVCDKVQFFQARNGFAVVSPEINAASGAFQVQLRFSPEKMGQFTSNLVVFGKGGGIWLIPLVGNCIKAPSAGIIGFE